MSDWAKELNVAITVSDENGNIVEMNDKSVKTFQNYGGKNLIGKSLFACHNENSGNIIKELASEAKTNAYTIEKNGIKKLIYQTPWFENGEFKGLVELSLEIPENMPHFKRD